MKQDGLDGLKVFVAVAEEKGFSAAAVKLGMSPSAVSQTIRQLEHRFGQALFNRTTRSVGLTGAGERYLARIMPALGELAAAGRELSADADQPVGLLRINVSRAACLIVLQPLLRQFLEAYPAVDVEIRLENTLIDIVAQGFDAGIRFGKLLEKDMVAIPVGPPIRAQIIAAPDYLARRGRPGHPRDLFEHDCIGFRQSTTGQVERWEFERDGESMCLALKGRLIVNDTGALVQAALDGLGVAYMINGYLERFFENGSLVRLLPQWSPAIPSLHLYYPDRRRVPAKLRALIDFLRARWPAVAQTATDRILLEDRPSASPGELRVI